MKVFTSFILSFIIFLASFQNSLIFLDYHINRDFYEEHCINKDKPEMDCHGKCEMKKQSEKTSSTFVVLKNFDFNFIPSDRIAIEQSNNKPVINKQSLFFTFNDSLTEGYYFIQPEPPQS